jgi:hypothetical protein
MANAASAFEVQANLEAVRMKGARPVEESCGGEVVAFEAETEIVEVAEERPPPRANGIPGGGFGERFQEIRRLSRRRSRPI